MVHAQCYDLAMEQQTTKEHSSQDTADSTKQDMTLDETFKEVKMENVKEMILDARERIGGIARAREQIDQKMTYFLGLLLLVFSSMAGFGIRPMLFLISEKKYFFVSTFMLFFIIMFWVICLLVRWLLPKNIYLTGLSPKYYWEGNRLTSNPKITLLSISKEYDHINNHMRSVIANKSRALRLSVFYFGIFILYIMCSVFLFHSDLQKALSLKV